MSYVANASAMQQKCLSVQMELILKEELKVTCDIFLLTKQVKGPLRRQANRPLRLCKRHTVNTLRHRHRMCLQRPSPLGQEVKGRKAPFWGPLESLTYYLIGMLLLLFG